MLSIATSEWLMAPTSICNIFKNIDFLGNIDFLVTLAIFHVVRNILSYNLKNKKTHQKIINVNNLNIAYNIVKFNKTIFVLKINLYDKSNIYTIHVFLILSVIIFISKFELFVYFISQSLKKLLSLCSTFCVLIVDFTCLPLRFHFSYVDCCFPTSPTLSTFVLMLHSPLPNEFCVIALNQNFQTKSRP